MQERQQKNSQHVRQSQSEEVVAQGVEYEGIDSLLDEIDGVLETNAEEFVQGFVQKGGQ